MEATKSSRVCKLHGEHSEWYWNSYGKSGKWICLRCKRDRRRAQRRSASYARVLEEFGPEVAQEYAELPEGQVPPIHSYICRKRWELGKPASLGYVGATNRLNMLNLLTGQPFDNCGWSCAMCDLWSSEPTFFDIDHIVPVSAGGTEALTNLRPLCPNCHRCRTQNLPDWGRLENAS